MSRKVLRLDIETYSGRDIRNCGVYAYTEDEDFEIILLGYAYNDGEVGIVDLTIDEIPEEVLADLTNPDVLKTAQNANFERTCLAKYYGVAMPPEQWRCTMIHGVILGLPASLDAMSEALNLQQRKDKEGKALIRYFCMPCKPTKANGGRTRNYPEHAPDKWKMFMEYCVQDVVVERAISNKLERFPFPPDEQKYWELDQRIVDAGVKIDIDLVNHAIACQEWYQRTLVAQAKRLTGLANPNSPAQLKEWLGKKGYEVTSINKEAISNLLADKSLLPEVREMLKLRQEMSKTSVKKYEKMRHAQCKDGRVRGLLQFYGANRTGRWAGRLVQVQNLPRNYIKDIAEVREDLKMGNYATFRMLYSNVPDVLSQLIRTAFIAEDGHTFDITDFSAIEARVIAWLAGEQWRLDVFRGHGKIYEASASQMFHIPMDEVDKELRQKGKVSELALGYNGGVNALIAMGALNMGLKEEELQGIVDAWRKASPAITKLWRGVENKAKAAIGTRKAQHYKGLTFYYKAGILFIELPSGRRLAYFKAQLVPGKYGDQIAYMGTSEKGWHKQHTYGGKLVENIVQAIARDCLAIALQRIEDAGVKTVMHVHDEAITEVPLEESSVDKLNALLAEPIPWAPDLPLQGDGFSSVFYMKD
ncbi:phage-related DNA polymerase family protein [Listeria weihenstephanensis FSL R9-0317]|uniref:DNA-directed DNA polymerase n=1 Tax=Listeria weihenstephanensis TaxID=1006155 RepID=A0A3B6XH48_9LIST|nr:DNA polymerase [Listeria weihenstephanensis]AQY50486.1 DNA polymerase [Listeria phage LWP01] [Listeria weihenstephanensis]AQY52630.1 DNA polymerase [Listeria phage LWP01]EUJ41504.1 phage-related DNA polymerase family protein [Listeria weihenstephanensis FSL R9-0317]